MTWPNPKRTSLQQMLAVLTALLLTSCASSPQPPLILRTELPPPPGAFGKPVQVPQPIRGQSSITYAGKVLGALAEANQRLANDAAYYDDLRKTVSPP